MTSSPRACEPNAPTLNLQAGRRRAFRWDGTGRIPALPPAARRRLKQWFTLFGCHWTRSGRRPSPSTRHPGLYAFPGHARALRFPACFPSLSQSGLWTRESSRGTVEPVGTGKGIVLGLRLPPRAGLPPTNLGTARGRRMHRRAPCVESSPSGSPTEGRGGRSSFPTGWPSITARNHGRGRSDRQLPCK